MDVTLNGCKSGGSFDCASAVRNLDAAGTAGYLYFPPGTYRFASSVTLTTPAWFANGAVLAPDAGATITLRTQPEAPLRRIFSGAGQITFGEFAVRVFPEWFGAAANGKTDDAGAIIKAYASIPGSANAMLYLTGSYGIGRTITFTPGVTIMSETTARFVAVAGNTAGVSFLPGGANYKVVLPHFDGFADYCFRLYGTDLGAVQLQTLNNCGDAIRVTTWPGGDQSNVLDNTVWFDAVTNSRYAVAIRPAGTCVGAACVIQGNQFIGTTIRGGPSSGLSSAVAFIYTGTEANVPAWDSNQFNFGTITPPVSNPSYSMFSAQPLGNREVITTSSVGTLPPGGKLFGGTHNIGQFSLTLTKTLAEGSLNLRGQLDLIELYGATTPASASTVIRTNNAGNSKASFNGGKALVGNYHSLTIVPDSDWPAGSIRTVYLYHQLATGYLYQIKCNAPTLASTGLKAVDCTQAADNSNGFYGTAVQNEVVLWVINLSGATIKKGATVPLTLAVATLGSA